MVILIQSSARPSCLILMRPWLLIAPQSLLERREQPAIDGFMMSTRGRLWKRLVYDGDLLIGPWINLFHLLQWDITCISNQWQLSLVGTLHFLGIVVGSATFGFLADKYGRKNLLIISIFFMSVTGIAQALSNSYIQFLIWNFLNAIGTSGVYPLAFILGELRWAYYL